MGSSSYGSLGGGGGGGCGVGRGDGVVGSVSCGLSAFSLDGMYLISSDSDHDILDDGVRVGTCYYSGNSL